MHGDDYYYSQEARDHDLKLVWECSSCGARREDYPGCNEGGSCSCGGEWRGAGESYTT